ncbi:hypothetical protein D3C81_2011350 [compost metagenome]
MLDDGGIDPGLGLFVIAQVDGGRAIQGKALGSHQSGRLFMAFGVKVATDHNRPFAGKTQCRGPALATTGTGDQRDFIT